jgi:hypothetical protein
MHIKGLKTFIKFIELMMKIGHKICLSKQYYGFYKRKERISNHYYKQDKFKCYIIKWKQNKAKNNIAELNELEWRLNIINFSIFIFSIILWKIKLIV